jgi:hypothetical protein
MFVRFRQVANRLQANLESTRRVAGKVKAEHIATLGSVPLAPSIADRQAFWAKANERLGRLANRIGPDTDKIIAALRERIPVVTADEVQAAQDRVERIAQGEIMSDATYEELMTALRACGWTTRDIQHMHRLGELHRIADRIGRREECRAELHAAARRAEITTTKLLLQGARIIEQEVIAAGIASAAEDGIEITPEEKLALLERNPDRGGGAGRSPGATILRLNGRVGRGFWQLWPDVYHRQRS